MPRRPHSHQIGEAAIQNFNALKPREWVTREKSSDYGVDLEVEIFEVDGRDTGLTFNVQSKGTAKEKLEKSVKISVETLKYLCSFDIPAIIFRHSESTGKSYWMWANEALLKASHGTRSVTIKFLERNLWSASTPTQLETSVRYRRVIRERARLTRFPIRFEANSAHEEIEFSLVSRDLLNSVPFLDVHRGREGLEIAVQFTPDEVTAKISDIANCTETVGSSAPEARTAALAYLISKLLSELNFNDHAERVANFCLERQLIAPSRLLACDASTALLRNPTSAVELAMLNDLHQTSDWLALLFASILRSSSNTYGHSMDAIVQFYRAMINAEHSKQGKASLLYTLGNFFRSKRLYASAVRAYNAARKADPTYKDRSYFQKELGGIFFMSRRYRWASRAYERLIEIEDTTAARFLYGDALLYAGNPIDAKPFLLIAAQEASPTGAEAYLKARLCEWLIDRGISAMDRPALLIVRELEQEGGNVTGTLWAQLAITFLLEDDVDCWADAIFLSLHRSDLYLEAVLLCAFERCGVEPFLLMKTRRAAFLELDSSILRSLEEMAATAIISTRQKTKYVPGKTSGEIDHLYEQQGIIRIELDPRF